MESQQFYSVEQVADILGLHVRTVRGYVRDGRLRAVRIGKQYRIGRDDLAALTGSPAAVVPAGKAGRRLAEVSTIVQIDALAPDAAGRLSTFLTAGVNVSRDSPVPLRVQTSYDEKRARMKIVIFGGVTDTADLLHLLDSVLNPDSGLLGGSGSDVSGSGVGGDGAGGGDA